MFFGAVAWPLIFCEHPETPEFHLVSKQLLHEIKTSLSYIIIQLHAMVVVVQSLMVAKAKEELEQEVVVKEEEKHKYLAERAPPLHTSGLSLGQLQVTSPHTPPFCSPPTSQLFKTSESCITSNTAGKPILKYTPPHLPNVDPLQTSATFLSSLT